MVLGAAFIARIMHNTGDGAVDGIEGRDVGMESECILPRAWNIEILQTVFDVSVSDVVPSTLPMAVEPTRRRLCRNVLPFHEKRATCVKRVSGMARAVLRAAFCIIAGTYRKKVECKVIFTIFSAYIPSTSRME